MRNAINWALVVLSAVVFYSCNKHPHSPTELRNLENLELIKEAKDYFTNEISPNLVTNSIQDRQIGSPSVVKIAKWEEAFVKKFSTGKMVVVPVSFQDAIKLKPNINAGSWIRGAKAMKLVVYKDMQKKFHAELLTIIPDSTYQHKPGQKFSGIIAAKDWHLNPLRAFRYVDGEVFQIIPQETSSSGLNNKTQLDVNITICNTIQWDIYVNGEYSYTYTENLGCQTVYVNDGGGPGAPFEGFEPGGGGGGSLEEFIPLPVPEGFSYSTADSGRLSCKSFTFTNATPTINWQEAGVKSLQFVGDWFGVFGGMTVKPFGNVYVGVPIEKQNGQIITPTQAATAAAQAANVAGKFLQTKYFGMPKEQFDIIPPSTIAREFRSHMALVLTNILGASCTVTNYAVGQNTILKQAIWNTAWGDHGPCL